MRLFYDIKLPLWILLSILVVSPCFGQTDKPLSAREIFYSAPPAPPAKKPAPQPTEGKEKKAVETAKSKTISPAPNSGKSTADIMTVSFNSVEGVPLGLRYSILKREGSASVEVDRDSVFHSGDRIRLRIEVNAAGYLYIINRGSSGNWKPLFPSSKIAGGDNGVRKGIQYEIPSGYVFSFDEQPGEEKLFIVFSRQPVTDLEDLIYSLSYGQKSKPQEPSQSESNKILLAEATIQDKFVDRLRTLYSRDLIIEKVDEKEAPPPLKKEKEKAVYVVNPSLSVDARVVADITLIHK
jgi:hypothetical protein